MPKPKPTNLLTMPTRHAWLNERRKGIGASDAPGVLNVSPWLTPLKVWLSKVETAPLGDDDMTERMRWGLRLEEAVAAAVAEDHNREVLTPASFYSLPHNRHHIVRDGEHDFLLASIDRFQRRKRDKRPGVLEIKTSAFADDWEGEPPIHYQVQLQHQLRVTGLEWGTLAVLIGGNKLLVADMERNDAFIERMVAVERRFWQSVLEHRPPSPGPLDKDALARLFPKEEPGTTIDLTLGVNGIMPSEVIERRVRLKKVLDVVSAEIDACDVWLKGLLGTAERGLLPDGSYVAWKTVESYEVPARTQPAFRKFNVHVPKKIKESFVPYPVALPAELPKLEEK